MTPPNRRCNLTAVSLFAGVGGFDLALQRAGVRVVAAVEIDPAARSVLARRFPDVTLFEDVREVTGDQLRAAGFVPDRGIITAGWPCQGNSVAGSRGGMADPRSGLWRHVVRLLADLDPAWFIGENVPGLLSVNGGDDFRVVLDDLARLGMGICWRILDAQHFGVPQRRRRVVIVGRAGGDARGPVEVLLEPEGGAGDSASRGAARQNLASTLGSRVGGSRTTDLNGHDAHIVSALTANGVGGGGGADDNAGQAGHLIATTVTARHGEGPDSDATTTLIPVTFDAAQITSKDNRSNPRPGDPAPSLAATGEPHVAYTLTGGSSSPGTSRPGRRTEDDGNLVVDTLRSHPRPGSNSVGAVVPVAMRGRGEGGRLEAGESGDPAFTLRTPGGGSSYPMIAHALTAEGADASEDGTGRGTPLVPMAFNPKTGGDMRLGYAEKPTALTSTVETAVQLPQAVRRLTPLECERLQGFPDEWTAGQKDAPRYRQMGNAVAVPVIEWVTRRLVAVDAASRPSGRP